MDEFSAQILRQRVEALESATALSIPAVQRLFEHRITTLERAMEALQVQVRTLQDRVEFLERKAASSMARAPRGQSGWWTREGQWSLAELLGSVPNLPHENNECDSPQASNVASSMTLLGELDPISHTQNLNVSWESVPPAVHASNGYPHSTKHELIHEVWDGSINWKKQHGELFDEDQSGIRYIPPPEESDVYRTVKIENLPANATMDQVLGQVCYGDVYSAHLLNTAGITGYHTAIIVFLSQREAIDFFKHAKSAGVYVNGVRVRTRIINTPTYPIPQDLRKRISQSRCTRCLSLSNVTPEIQACLQKILERSICKHYIECLQESSSRGKLVIRFHSIKMASQAYDLLAKAPIFKDCFLRFSADPCSRIPRDAK